MRRVLPHVIGVSTGMAVLAFSIATLNPDYAKWFSYTKEAISCGSDVACINAVERRYIATTHVARQSNSTP